MEKLKELVKVKHEAIFERAIYVIPYTAKKLFKRI